MSLELNPDIESQVNAAAAREGLSASDYIARLIRATSPAPRFAPRLRVLPPEEAKRQNAASIAHLQAQLDEAEKATPEEVAQADAEWRSFQKTMNDNRRASGERLLYKEDTQQ